MTKIAAEEFWQATATDMAVVVFTAAWCEPCQLLRPVLETIQKRFPVVAFFSVDCDDNRSLVRQLKINSIPTLQFYHHGRLIKELFGLQNEETLSKVLEMYG